MALGESKHLLGLLEGESQHMLSLIVGKVQQLLGRGHGRAHHGEYGFWLKLRRKLRAER